jgi:cobalt/nickel transport system ATP-binding protein
VASATEAVLRVEGVSHAYLGRFAALDDITLEIVKGEKVALVGANGCGKSTMLKVLDALVFPDRGRFVAFGHAITERGLEDDQLSQAFRSRVGFVFQNSDAQVFSPTVRDEIAFGPLNMGLPVDEVRSRVDDVLAVLDMDGLADRAPYQLSGGQKKRVAIASVLVMNPEVLLFDEPTAALDPRTQHWLIELILELNEAGKTIVIATHDLDTLPILADRCVVFGEDHRIMADAPTFEVLKNTDLLFAVNVIHAHAHRHGEGWHVHDHEAGHHDSPA